MEQSHTPLPALSTSSEVAAPAQEEQPGEDEEDEGTQPEGEQQEAPEAGEAGAQATAATPASVAAGSVPTVAASPAPPYDYEKTTIVLVAQFRPLEEEGQPREIWLSAQNGVGNELDFPLFRVLTEAELGGAWPAVVTQLLDRLRQDLPERQRRHASRHANRPAMAPAPAARPASARTASSPAAKPKPAAAVPSAPPPVPTATNPIAKSGLAMPGLFDGLDEQG